jgi:ABC-type multidrug transport system ATPase subunit/ABC-type multidrug transport system permease subunit
MPVSGISVDFCNVQYCVPRETTGWARRLVGGAQRIAARREPVTYAHELDLESANSTTQEHTNAASVNAVYKILCGVSGHISPGESLAILGPSGSGKTSLLNLLSGRSRYEAAGGNVLFDGSPRNDRTKRHIGYVMQDDVFFTNLTVRQTLEFTAAIRLSGTLTKEEISDRVTKVVSRLRLEKCQDTRIGDQQFDKGVSGGERKRVNIANELLADPSILLLDEPTSGLDASTAMTVVRLLRELADEGTTIVSTIHQPSSAMFGLFDKLMLLSDGNVAYFGPACEVRSYFSSVGYPFPPSYNPCDYLMQLLIDDVPCNYDGINPELFSAAERRSETSVVRLIRLWSEREQETKQNEYNENSNRPNVPSLNRLEKTCKGISRAFTKRACDIIGKPDPLGLSSKYETSWFTQFRVLSIRSMRQRRSRVLKPIQLQQLAALIFISSVFWFQMARTEATIGDRLGGLFFFNLLWSVVSMFSTLFAFPSERAVLNKDRASGAYRLSAYYVAKTLVETPAECIYPLIFSVIVYWVVGLRSSAAGFLIFVVILMASVLTWQAIGLAISASMMDIERAQVLAFCIALASMLMAGYYVNSNNIPDFIEPLKYLSFMKYAYEAFLRNEVIGQEYSCVVEGFAHTIYSQNGKQCPVRGPDVLFASGAEHSLSVLGNLGVLLAWNILFRLCGYIALKYLNIHHKPTAIR